MLKLTVVATAMLSVFLVAGCTSGGQPSDPEAPSKATSKAHASPSAPNSSPAADSSPTPTLGSVLPDLDPEPGEDASYSGGPLLYPEATYECRYVPTEDLFPTGVVARDLHDSVTIGESSGCSFTLDTNGDGFADSRDATGDDVRLEGGLTDAIDGSVADVSSLQGEVFWGSYACNGSWSTTAAPEGWTRADQCIDDGELRGLAYLLVGHTPDDEPAAFSCSVGALGPVLQGREFVAESACFAVMQGLLGGD